MSCPSVIVQLHFARLGGIGTGSIHCETMEETMQKALIDKDIILPSGKISKDKKEKPDCGAYSRDSWKWVWMVMEGKQKAVYEIGLVTIEAKRCAR